ncbi:MAG: site-specific integrase [Bacteroidota bacterium]
MATVTPILRTSKRDKRGRCPIWLRLSDRDGTRYLSLGVKVLPSQWNDRQRRVRKGHPNADLINRLISERLIEAEAQILQLKIEHTYATADHLKDALGEDGATDFFAAAEEHRADLQRLGNVGRYRRLGVSIGKLEDYLRRENGTGRPLPFDRFTSALLTGFETYCRAEPPDGLGNKQSTVATNLRDLRALFNHAVKRGYASDAASPFKRFRIRHGPPPERTKLSFAEVQAVEALDLEASTPIWHARNYFLFAFYGGGIRFADVATMTQARVTAGTDAEGNPVPDRLQFRAGKTGKLQSVKITPPARRILAHYLDRADGDAQRDPEAFIFPMLDGYDLSTPEKLYNAKSSQNALVNKYLRQVADLAGIAKPLSMHIARHSFADVARSSGWSIYDIKNALQHSSLEKTERYLKGFDADALDARMDDLFGE